jgi:uncharacterized protein (DUF1501 family)
MKRRTFLKNTAAAATATALAPYIMKGQTVEKIPNDKIAQIADDNIVIIIEMFGGNDGLNTIIPAYNDRYYQLRPILGIPKNIAKEVVKDKVYMAPFIVDGIYNGGMKRLFDTGRLALVEGVGYRNPTLSHFRSEDIHLSGINTTDPKVALSEGWMGRYFLNKLPDFPNVVPEHPLSICLDSSISLLFKTNKGHMSIALTDPKKFYDLGVGLNPLPNIRLKTGTNKADAEFNFVHVQAQQSDLYARAVWNAYEAGKSKLKVSYSNGLSKKFEMISALIAGGLKTKVFFVKLSNFDSHAQQMNADYTGQHPTLVGQVASAVSEFLDDAQQQGWGERVVGMTVSEFGRRPYDNASRGTDHGAANVQFVFGGSSDFVNGGYHGDPPDLDHFDVDGNINYQVEYRRTFVDILQNWMGAEKKDIVDVFGEDILPIGVIKPRVTNVDDFLTPKDGKEINVYPSPTRGNGTVSFTIKKRSMVDVNVYDTPGFVVRKIYSGWLEPGDYNMPFNVNKAGAYIASVVSNNRRYSFKFQVIR